MSILFLALLLVAQSQPASSSIPGGQYLGLKLDGSGYDGLSIGYKTDSSGAGYAGLVQSKSNSSPPPPEIAAIAIATANAYLNKKPDLYGKYVKADAESYIRSVETGAHRKFIDGGFPFPEVANLALHTPYYLGSTDGEHQVRLEWLKDNQLMFISFLKIRDGQILQVVSDAARVPPIVPAPLNRPKVR